MKNKQNFSKLLPLLAGLAVYELGAAILLLSGFGADPFNVLIDGLHSTIGLTQSSFLTHGIIHISISALLTLLLWVLNHSLIQTGTVVCMLLGGPLIDLFVNILTPVYEQYTNASYFYLMFLAGFVMLAYGMSLMLHSNAGFAPNELITEIFPKLKKKNPYYAALAAYTMFALIGFLFGGRIGFGTLLCMTAALPLSEYFTRNLSQKAANASR